jgi:hypothetical protein
MSHESDGQDAGGRAEIRWVGEQRLMDGYCGRAPAPAAPVAGPEARPVAPVRSRPRQRKLVRVGPPKAGPTPATAGTPQAAA